MMNWSHIAAQQERYDDLLHEAERERLFHRASTDRKRLARLYAQILVWLGHRLVDWGWRLQARRGAVAAAVRPCECQPYLGN